VCICVGSVCLSLSSRVDSLWRWDIYFMSWHTTVTIPVLLLLAIWELAFSLTHGQSLYSPAIVWFICPHQSRDRLWNYLSCVVWDVKLQLSCLNCVPYRSILLPALSCIEAPYSDRLFSCHFVSFVCEDPKKSCQLEIVTAWSRISFWWRSMRVVLRRLSW